jgi:hypothetical protein
MPQYLPPHIVSDQFLSDFRTKIVYAFHNTRADCHTRHLIHLIALIIIVLRVFTEGYAFVSFEVPTALKIHILFWIMMLCSLVG